MVMAVSAGLATIPFIIYLARKGKLFTTPNLVIIMSPLIVIT